MDRREKNRTLMATAIQLIEREAARFKDDPFVKNYIEHRKQELSSYLRELDEGRAQTLDTARMKSAYHIVDNIYSTISRNSHQIEEPAELAYLLVVSDLRDELMDAQDD